MPKVIQFLFCLHYFWSFLSHDLVGRQLTSKRFCKQPKITVIKKCSGLYNDMTCQVLFWSTVFIDKKNSNILLKIPLCGHWVFSKPLPSKIVAPNLLNQNLHIVTPMLCPLLILQSCGWIYRNQLNWIFLCIIRDSMLNGVSNINLQRCLHAHSFPLTFIMIFSRSFICICTECEYIFFMS